MILRTNRPLRFNFDEWDNLRFTATKVMSSPTCDCIVILKKIIYIVYIRFSQLQLARLCWYHTRPTDRRRSPPLISLCSKGIQMQNKFGHFSWPSFCQKFSISSFFSTIFSIAVFVTDLVCPMNISLVLSNTENSGFVSWNAPIPPSGLTLVAGPSVTQGFYPRGTNTSILYIFQTSNNDYEFCKFYVEVGKWLSIHIHLSNISFKS